MIFLFWAYSTVQKDKTEERGLALLELAGESISQKIDLWNDLLALDRTYTNRHSLPEEVISLSLDKNGQTLSAMFGKGYKSINPDVNWQQYNFFHTPWFQEAIGGATKWTQKPLALKFLAEATRIENLNVFILARPQVNDRRDITGVLVYFFDSMALAKPVNEVITKNGLEGYVVIADRNNSLLTPTNIQQKLDNYYFRRFHYQDITLNLYAHTPPFKFWRDFLAPFAWPLSFYILVVLWLSLELSRTMSRSYYTRDEKIELSLSATHEIIDEEVKILKAAKPKKEKTLEPSVAIPKETKDRFTALELLAQNISVQVNLLAVNSTVAAIAKSELSDLAMSANELSEKTTLMEQNILNQIRHLRKSA